MQDTKQYELEELLAEANRLRRADAELANTAAFNSRTIYYYVQEGLLPGRSGRRGPGTRYSQQFLYKLLLIRRLQKETTLKLSDIREVMARIQPDSLKAVALGEESIEVASVVSYAEATQVAQTREDRTMLQRSVLSESDRDVASFAANEPQAQLVPDYGAPTQPKMPQQASVKADAFEDHSVPTLSPGNRIASVGIDGDGIATTFPLGEGAELVIRQPLTGKQMRQLENIA
ncbi:MAG: MerR family transcriptional regulator, partial [Pseudomonadales bacterium]|nr:MerR family transcriptional regulator [Pseudomonadales bacterium]